MNKHFYNLGLLFEDVASSHTKRVSLHYSDQQYSYDELTKWVERLAFLLLTKGAERGDVIAIANNKHPLSYALMLAAIRLGIAYVNIDTASPTARNSHILKMSGATLLFYDDVNNAQAMEDLARINYCQLIKLDSNLLPTISEQDRDHQQQLMQQVDGASIAYIMFTSGSTGIPKGVAVTHQNLLHFIYWGQEYFKITSEDNFANLSPMYFDNSVFDFYIGLFSGASLTPISRELMNNPYELVAHVGKMTCSIWFSVPSLLIYLMSMKAMTSVLLPTLRHIIFGGEGYPKPELKKLFDLFYQQSTLTNVYGPTECTCICSAYPLTLDDFSEMNGLPPLGSLNPNFDYRITDEQDQDADEGELCLIGPNVAAGYFNDLERSAASFIALTEPSRFMKRMYRTGDLVKKINSTLHFIGRKDNQIKHMGYRIELEEIEHALIKIPHIIQAAVLYQRTNTAYGKLISFVATHADIDEKFILAELAKVLPSYMLPARVAITTDLPKNPNGKVDRIKLQNMLLMQ